MRSRLSSFEGYYDTIEALGYTDTHNEKKYMATCEQAHASHESFKRESNVSLGSRNKSIHLLVQLLRILKDVPYVLGDILERLLESFWCILLTLIGFPNIRNFADEDGTNPLGLLAIHLAVGFGIALGAVTDADEFAFREPLVNLFHPVDFVGLGSLRKVGKETSQIHP